MSDSPKMVMLGVKVTPEQAERAKAEARRERRPVSGFVRNLLCQYFDHLDENAGKAA